MCERSVPDAVLKVGGYAPRDSSHSNALAIFAEQVDQRTEGRVGVELLWNILDEGRPASALLERVESGELAMCYFSTSYLGSRVPLLNILETPFLFDGLDQAHRSAYRPLKEETPRNSGVSCAAAVVYIQ